MKMTEEISKGSLPHGWIVKTSKRYPNRIYYFNVFTGSSTWDCPVLDPPRVESKEDQDAEDFRSQSLPETFSKPLPIQKKLTSSSLKDKHDNVVPHNSARHSNEHSPISSNDDSSKVYSPPTAIVVPVIHKNVRNRNSVRVGKSSSNFSDFPVDKSDENKKTADVKKRKSDEQDCSTSDSVKKKKITKNKKKKKMKSPLNSCDSMREKISEAKKEKKILKKAIHFSEKSLHVNASEGTKRNSAGLLPGENKDVEDIEMLDVSMEIIDDLTEKKETDVDAFASYYIVVDTNVLISELSLINELKDTPVNGCGPPHIFLPWVVIEELDKLKSNRNVKQNTIRAASEAVRYLNSVLGKHPRFHGQSPAEAEDWAKTYSKCNDDKILECCMGLTDKMSQEKVILLTNDKNLVNKALICNINVHNWSSMMESVKPDVFFSFTKNKKRNSVEKETFRAGSTNEMNRSSEESEEKKLQNRRNTFSREIHTLMCTARQLLKNVLAKFLEEEMNDAYGSPWLLFPIQRKLLEGILEAIIRYWRMVFSAFLNENDKKSFELLYVKSSRPEGFLADKEECLDILSTIEDVFRKIKKRRPQIKVPVERIHEFRVACVEAFYSYCEVESTIKEAERASTLALFEKNWCAINQLCGMISDFCGIEHDFEYDKPKEVPQEPEFRRLICNLYPEVQQLKTLMFNILQSVRKSNVNKTVIKKFSNALLKFIPSLEIPYEAVSYPHFSAKALERFCYYAENREMIEIGYKQIEKFYSKLDVALTVIMSTKLRKRAISPETMICD